MWSVEILPKLQMLTALKASYLPADRIKECLECVYGIGPKRYPNNANQHVADTYEVKRLRVWRAAWAARSAKSVPFEA